MQQAPPSQSLADNLAGGYSSAAQPHGQLQAAMLWLAFYIVHQ